MAAERPAAGPARAQAVQEQATGKRQCLSEQEVRNMETSASSITLDAYDRQVAAADIRRAKRCEPLMSAAERAMMKADLQSKNRRGAQAQAPEDEPRRQYQDHDRLQQCIYGNCGSSSGATYREHPAGGYERREDGARCQRSPAGMGEISCR